MSLAIKIENVSKLYRLGEVGTGTLSHDLNRWWHRIRGKEDPYAEVGRVNDRTKAIVDSNDYVWALRDINIEVEQGEILGIIGRNGAGKSTLLKLLSRVTAPTSGEIKTRGRIASLLEVGTGFHPELTGRENIYLNGAILGMKRLEISNRLDEIVEFSGCSKYIDTPTKRYSSGMTVRLGFAVAAHLECETLIVDEVLAVGDQEFRKKCIGKMQEISTNSQRTVLFVSHNMASIERLCSRSVVMDNGRVVTSGPVAESVVKYLEMHTVDKASSKLMGTADRSGSGEARLRGVELLDKAGVRVNAVRCGGPMKLRFRIENDCRRALNGVSVGYSLSDHRGQSLVVSYSDYESVLLCIQPGSTDVDVTVQSVPLVPGVYKVGFRLLEKSREIDWPRYDVFEIIVEGGDYAGNASSPHSGRGCLLFAAEWCVNHRKTTMP